MKQLFNQEVISSYIKLHHIDSYFENLHIPKCIIEYESGEFLSSPLLSNHYIQFIIEGEVNIHYIREDGTLYSLANCGENYMIVEQQLFFNTDDAVYAVAITPTKCIAISIDQCHELLLNDKIFLRKTAEKLCITLSTITKSNASSIDLQSRTFNYMKYRCKDGSFTGLEKTAFDLHYSTRQLQRVLNKLESLGIIKKTGKGAYQLL